MADEVARCAYGRCRAELPPPGLKGGRPRTFCKDRRWEGDRTCAQMARSERVALEALGLDGGGTAYALDADRLREQVEAVQAPVQALGEALAAVLTRLDEVQRDAVGAVDRANQRVAEADEARAAAETGRERAVEQARRAKAAADEATAEREEAVARAAAAAARALEATEALGAARQVADAATATQSRAEERASAAEQATRAAEVGAAVAVEQARAERDSYRERAVVATGRVDELAERLAGAQQQIDALTGAAADAATRAAVEAASAAAELVALRAELAALDTVLVGERTAREAAEAAHAALTATAHERDTELARVRAELAAAAGVRELIESALARDRGADGDTRPDGDAPPVS